jgi:hypothetical protein
VTETRPTPPDGPDDLPFEDPDAPRARPGAYWTGLVVLAAGLAVLVNALDVDRVVLGGPIWSRISSSMLAVLPGLIQPQLAAALSSAASPSSSPNGASQAARSSVRPWPSSAATIGTLRRPARK